VPGTGKAPWHIASRGVVVDDYAQERARREGLQRETRLQERVGTHLASEVQLLGDAAVGNGPAPYFSTGRPGVLPHSIHEAS
jgi:hypothetical protein